MDIIPSKTDTQITLPSQLNLRLAPSPLLGFLLRNSRFDTEIESDSATADENSCSNEDVD